jgi:hypothetical protein
MLIVSDFKAKIYFHYIIRMITSLVVMNVLMFVMMRDWKPAVEIYCDSDVVMRCEQEGR